MSEGKSNYDGTREVSKSEFDVCRKCKTDLGVVYFTGRKRQSRKDQDGERWRHRAPSVRYYCTSECLEQDGALEEASF